MPTMSDCIADVNRCVRQIRTLNEKRAKTTRAALRDGIEADRDYWISQLWEGIVDIGDKLGDQYDWMGRNPHSSSLQEIWESWLTGLDVYMDARDYYERLPKQTTMEGAS